MKNTTVETIDPGDKVNCDICNADFSDSNEQGGFMFQSKGVCPDCEDDFLRDVKKFKEERFITAWCPKGSSFKTWMLDLREDWRNAIAGL